MDHKSLLPIPSNIHTHIYKPAHQCWFSPPHRQPLQWVERLRRVGVADTDPIIILTPAPPSLTMSLPFSSLLEDDSPLELSSCKIWNELEKSEFKHLQADSKFMDIHLHDNLTPSSSSSSSISSSMVYGPSSSPPSSPPSTSTISPSTSATSCAGAPTLSLLHV